MDSIGGLLVCVVEAGIQIETGTFSGIWSRKKP